jgi:hypothetical protein
MRFDTAAYAGETFMRIKFNFGYYLMLVLCFESCNLYLVQLAFCLFYSDVKILEERKTNMGNLMPYKK